MRPNGNGARLLVAAAITAGAIVLVVQQCSRIERVDERQRKTAVGRMQATPADSRSRESKVTAARPPSALACPHVVGAGGPACTARPDLAPNWQRRVGAQFYTAPDYFAFVRAHAAAAYAGDRRAAFYIGETVKRCASTMELYRLVGQTTDDFNACAGFGGDPPADPFADVLPARPGGYPWQYWHARALAGDDPLALVTDAVEQRTTAGAPVAQVRRAVALAVGSGDPDAYLAVGQALTNGAIGADPVDGIAWILVACETGVDCRLDNPQVGYMHCAAVGACPAGMELPAWLRAKFGDDAATEAEGRRDAILAALDAGKSVASFVQVRE